MSFVDSHVTYPDHWHLNPTLLAASTILTDCHNEINSYCLATADVKKAISCLSEPENIDLVHQTCRNALLPKGSISATFDDVWDIAHALQMANFTNKER